MQKIRVSKPADFIFIRYPSREGIAVKAVDSNNTVEALASTSIITLAWFVVAYNPKSLWTRNYARAQVDLSESKDYTYLYKYKVLCPIVQRQYSQIGSSMRDVNSKKNLTKASPDYSTKSHRTEPIRHGNPYFRSMTATRRVGVLRSGYVWVVLRCRGMRRGV